MREVYADGLVGADCPMPDHPHAGCFRLFVERAQSGLDRDPGEFNPVSNSQLIAERYTVPFNCLHTAVESFGNICGGETLADVRKDLYLALGER